MQPHPLYSRDASVIIEEGFEKLQLLDRAIERSQFLENVESVFRASGKAREQFLIAIKPNLMTASIPENPSPVYTNPDLVEHLIGRLRDRGFTDIALVEARNVYDYSYQGRSVQAVAEMVGYSCQGYRVEDLSEQKEPFDYGGVLGRHYVGRSWRDADYRISFAKNKSHWQCFYTGCMKNVYGCLPEWDKMKHYHESGRKFYECCILILDNFPVHFGFLDAYVSGDGFAGHVRDPDPNPTHSIFASANVFALDWVMGEKMGVNPALNFVVQEALHRWGTFHITRVGNLAPWPDWHNVRPFVIVVMSVAERFYGFSRFCSRALASDQDKRFPPVSRWQWFFGILQRISKMVERLAETKKPLKGKVATPAMKSQGAL